MVNWLLELMATNERAWANCRSRIELLAQSGHELRRPAADYLRDGIYELRAKQGHVQYRLLYFFHGRSIAILAQGLTKRYEVPIVVLSGRSSESSVLKPIRKRILMKPKTEMKKTSDAVLILDRMAGEKPNLRRLTEEARFNAAVAQLIYVARTKAGLAQADLAGRIGTRQSVISRLEDADYEGHSLNMLHRIAAALGQRIEIKFLPSAKPRRSRRSAATVLQPVPRNKKPKSRAATPA